MRITYSISPMATWVRAVRRMPTTAITSKTTMTAVLMKMFGQVLTALTPRDGQDRRGENHHAGDWPR